MYTIEITYETGNSFGSHIEVDLIGMCWNDITKAADALSEIRKHNQYFNDKRHIKWCKDFKENKEYDDITEHSIKLKNDDNKDIIIGAFWRGYFERLVSIKIVIDDPNNEYFLDI